MSLENQQATEEEDLELNFNPVFATFRKRDFVAKLEWKDIDYHVGKKHIIKSVSGESNPGEVVAIMGPSGSGKTTLLNIISGRIQPGGNKKLQGKVTMNKEQVKPMQFRKLVAYVTQDDAMFATATVRESLEFSCRLRLPAKTTREERERIVSDIIESLGLRKCEHTMIGSETIRGVSGGEKKRVAIGVELVSNPSILFLDEPTSGLDSHSAMNVVRLLKAIAKSQSGLTNVICSIHQPSSEIFHLFDSLILLGAGTVVFQGPVTGVQQAFQKSGIIFPSGVNIADFILLLVQTRPLDKLPSNSKNENRNDVWEVEPQQDVEANKKMRPKMLSLRMFAEDDEARHGMLYQSYWLMIREFRAIWRDKVGFLGRFGATAILMALFAILFQGVGDQNNPKYSVQSHYGALVNIVITVLYDAAQPALLTFAAERVVFIREKATGTYGTVPYVFSKLLVELPVLFLVSLETMLITYWASGFRGNFFFLILSLWALMLAAVSLALVLASIASTAKVAMDWATLLLLPQLLFLGLFVRLDQMPTWLSWAQYLCSAKYALNLAMIVEFDPSLAINHEIRAEWALFLESNTVRPSEAWMYSIVLIAIFVGFRIMAMMILDQRTKRLG